MLEKNKKNPFSWIQPNTHRLQLVEQVLDVHLAAGHDLDLHVLHPLGQRPHALTQV